MKLATWNVNSLKVRLPQVLEFPAAPETGCIGAVGNQTRGC